MRALLIDQRDGAVTPEITDIDEARLPAGEVLVRVRYSTVNYKDGMVLGGKGRIVREYPHVPGIDYAGVVEASEDPRYAPGDEVVLTGWRVGETHWGGYADKARAQGEWLVPLPAGFSLHDAMVMGTAGLTAALGVLALEAHGMRPGDGEVLVTGASGGVGAVAVALLAAGGYQVVAMTGRPDNAAWLQDLGAAEVMGRGHYAEAPARPLAKARWQGVVDCTGGMPLANALAETQPYGSVAAIGNAAGVALGGTVLPFLLRGVNLLGIESTTCPRERRLPAWERLAHDLKKERFAVLTETVGLAEVPRVGRDILAGKVRGRVVIDLHR